MEKKLPDLIQQIRADHPSVTSWELWTMDEHRIGLKPIVRRVWAHKGERPIITVAGSWCRRASIWSFNRRIH
jgi:hypothetical protein